MNVELRGALIKCETDIDAAVDRLSGDENLYISCLKSFLEDRTIAELDNAIKGCSWDDAFTSAHALKGVAGNMGFVPLYHAAAELVIIIRAGRTTEIVPSYTELKRCYDAISRAIYENCDINMGTNI